MAQKSGFVRMVFGQNPTFRNGQNDKKKPDHNNPATLEQFDRERMGVAAKE